MRDSMVVDDEFNYTLVVYEITGALGKITRLVVPEEALPFTDVNGVCDVKNVGNEDGYFKIVIKINDSEEEYEFDLIAGGEATVHFTFKMGAIKVSGWIGLYRQEDDVWVLDDERRFSVTVSRYVLLILVPILGVGGYAAYRVIKG